MAIPDKLPPTFNLWGFMIIGVQQLAAKDTAANCIDSVGIVLQGGLACVVELILEVYILQCGQKIEIG